MRDLNLNMASTPPTRLVYKQGECLVLRACRTDVADVNRLCQMGTGGTSTCTEED